MILQSASHDKIRAILKTPEFRDLVYGLLQHKRKFFEADAWFQKTHPGASLSTIAYFSMEFMLTETLQIIGERFKHYVDLITGIPQPLAILRSEEVLLNREP